MCGNYFLVIFIHVRFDFVMRISLYRYFEKKTPLNLQTFVIAKHTHNYAFFTLFFYPGPSPIRNIIFIVLFKRNKESKNVAFLHY